MNKKRLIILATAVALLILELSLFFGFFPKNLSPVKKQAEPILRPTATPAPQATLFLLPSPVGGEIRLKTSLKNISGFSLRLISEEADSFDLNPNPELKKAGWQFPVYQEKANQIDLAGVYIKPEPYLFEEEMVIAWLLIKPDSWLPEEVSFQFAPEFTKITTKDGNDFTPKLEVSLFKEGAVPPQER